MSELNIPDRTFVGFTSVPGVQHMAAGKEFMSIEPRENQ